MLHSKVGEEGSTMEKAYQNTIRSFELNDGNDDDEKTETS